MTGWDLFAVYFLVTVCLILMFITGVIVTIVIIAKKKKPKVSVAFTLSCLGMIIVSGLFIGSHSIYFTFNDWSIKGNNISDVVKKYGEPDIWYSDKAGIVINVIFRNGEAEKKEPVDQWKFERGKSGRLGYYIYTDTGHVMSDYLPHYYYVKYNEQGVVTDVCDGTHPGG